MSQRSEILKYLMKGKSITSWEAFEKFGATRLSAIIYDLRKDAHRIGGVSCREQNGRKFWNLNKPYQTFSVKEIEYDANREISKITIVDSRGNVVWSNKH